MSLPEDKQFSLFLFSIRRNTVQISLSMPLILVPAILVVVVRQNEELERVVAELRETQDQIITQQKLAELGELTAGVAHEIRSVRGTARRTERKAGRRG